MRGKKITDLNSTDQPIQIDLSTNTPKSPTPKFFFNKKPTHQHLNDLTGTQKTPQQNDFPKHTPPKYLGDLLRIAFFGLIIIIILTATAAYFSTRTIKQEVQDEAHKGIDLLVSSAKNLKDFTSAIKTFNQARITFLSAEKKLWFLSADNSLYLRDSDLTYSISSLIEGGNHFANAGAHLLKALEEFNKTPLYFVSHNENTTKDSPKATETIKKGLLETEKALIEINLAATKIDQVNPSALPEQIQKPVTALKENLSKTQTNLQQISDYFPAILKLLGEKTPHRYMIILQNNDELRATGGFIGSYALFEIQDAKIQNLAVHDVYDLNSNANKTPLPIELQGLFNSEVDRGFQQFLFFRDANYSPDFPTSAQTLYTMFRKEGGPEVDTIIAINQGLLNDLLQITGPVQVGDFGQFTSANYNLLLTYIIESKIWGSEDPKHILKVFIPAFQAALLKEQNLSQIATKLYRAIGQKHILLYSRDQKIQGLFEFLNLSGTVRQAPDEDYLQIINTSIGTKTDKFIEETIDHKTTLTKSRETIDELTITRKHLWDDKILLDWQNLLTPYGFNLSKIPPHIIDILGRGTNKTLTRIYVPKNSVIIEPLKIDELQGSKERLPQAYALIRRERSDEADAVDSNFQRFPIKKYYDKNLDKDYYQILLETPAKTTTTLKIRYKLPEKFQFDSKLTKYKIFIAKQPGSRGSLLNKTIETENNLNLLRSYPETTSTEQLKINTNLVYDRYFSTIWQK